MKDSVSFRRRVIIIISSLVILTLYLYVAVPSLTSSIEKLSMENKLMERDLGELDALGGDMESVESSIDDTETELSEIKGKASIDGESYDEDISDMAKKAGITIKEMDQEEPKIIGEKQKQGNTLHSQPAMITFTGSFKNGIKLFESFENSEDGLYIIDDYLFKRNDKKEDKSEWIINIQVYYYK